MKTIQHRHLNLEEKELALLSEILKKTSVGQEYESIYLSLRGKVNDQVQSLTVGKQIQKNLNPSRNGHKHVDPIRKNRH